MDWKRLALILTTASSLAMVGCGDDDDNGTNGDPDAQTGELDECFTLEPPATDNCEEEGDTHWYVVNVLDFGSQDFDTGQTPGFNIDGCNTRVDGSAGNTGCGHMDHQYDIDQDGVVEGPERGIDNMMSALSGALGSFLDVQEMVDDGEILILVEVSGVTDLQNDSCVNAALYLGQLPEGEELENGIEPGMMFEIDPDSLDDMGEPLVQAEGVLEDGRLIIGPVDIVLDIPFEGEEVTFAIENGQVALTLGENELSEGVIGGGLDVADLSQMVEELAGLDIGGLLEMNADLWEDENNENCESISISLTFGAVDAVVTEPEEEAEAL